MLLVNKMLVNFKKCLKKRYKPTYNCNIPTKQVTERGWIMAEQSLKPIVDKLENLFSKFNEKFYGGELQKPIITVSPDTTKGAYGWCTSWKVWSNKEPKAISEMKPEEVEAMKNEGFYEINLCAEHLARPFEHVAETLLHEMVHLYNLQVGVQDTSRSGTYHNKKYKEAAEQL